MLSTLGPNRALPAVRRRTERDVFGLHANVRRDDVYLYPLRLDAWERRRVIEAAVARLGEPEKTAVFYHSLSSNCTTNLVELLRAGRSDVLPAWHWWRG